MDFKEGLEVARHREAAATKDVEASRLALQRARLGHGTTRTVSAPIYLSSSDGTKVVSVRDSNLSMELSYWKYLGVLSILEKRNSVKNFNLRCNDSFSLGLESPNYGFSTYGASSLVTPSLDEIVKKALSDSKKRQQLGTVLENGITRSLMLEDICMSIREVIDEKIEVLKGCFVNEQDKLKILSVDRNIAVIKSYVFLLNKLLQDPEEEFAIIGRDGIQALVLDLARISAHVLQEALVQGVDASSKNVVEVLNVGIKGLTLAHQIQIGFARSFDNFLTDWRLLGMKGKTRRFNTPLAPAGDYVFRLLKGVVEKFASVDSQELTLTEKSHLLESIGAMAATNLEVSCYSIDRNLFKNSMQLLVVAARNAKLLSVSGQAKDTTQFSWNPLTWFSSSPSNNTNSITDSEIASLSVVLKSIALKSIFSWFSHNKALFKTETIHSKNTLLDYLLGNVARIFGVLKSELPSDVVMLCKDFFESVSSLKKEDGQLGNLHISSILLGKKHSDISGFLVNNLDRFIRVIYKDVELTENNIVSLQRGARSLLESALWNADWYKNNPVVTLLGADERGNFASDVELGLRSLHAKITETLKGLGTKDSFERAEALRLKLVNGLVTAQHVLDPVFDEVDLENTLEGTVLNVLNEYLCAVINLVPSTSKHLSTNRDVLVTVQTKFDVGALMEHIIDFLECYAMSCFNTGNDIAITRVANIFAIMMEKIAKSKSVDHAQIFRIIALLRVLSFTNLMHNLQDLCLDKDNAAFLLNSAYELFSGKNGGANNHELVVPMLFSSIFNVVISSSLYEKQTGRFQSFLPNNYSLMFMADVLKKCSNEVILDVINYCEVYENRNIWKRAFGKEYKSNNTDETITSFFFKQPRVVKAVFSKAITEGLEKPILQIFDVVSSFDQRQTDRLVSTLIDRKNPYGTIRNLFKVVEIACREGGFLALREGRFKEFLASLHNILLESLGELVDRHYVIEAKGTWEEGDRSRKPVLDVVLSTADLETWLAALTKCRELFDLNNRSIVLLQTIFKAILTIRRGEKLDSNYINETLNGEVVEETGLLRVLSSMVEALASTHTFRIDWQAKSKGGVAGLTRAYTRSVFAKAPDVFSFAYVSKLDELDDKATDSGKAKLD